MRLANLFSDALPGRYFAAVLNKQDLIDAGEAEVPKLPAGLLKPYFPVFQTSAKTGQNVKQTFCDAAETIVRRGL